MLEPRFNRREARAFHLVKVPSLVGSRHQIIRYIAALPCKAIPDILFSSIIINFLGLSSSNTAPSGVSRPAGTLSACSTYGSGARAKAAGSNPSLVGIQSFHSGLMRLGGSGDDLLGEDGLDRVLGTFLPFSSLYFLPLNAFIVQQSVIHSIL